MAGDGVPGLSAPPRTDLPVLHPFRVGAHHHDPFSPLRLLGRLPAYWALLLVLAWPAAVFAQSGGFGMVEAFGALWRWIPFLTFEGFLFNILISVFVMGIGTASGVLLGLGQISRSTSLRRASWFTTQLFRNAPWLVLLFIVLLALPFEFEIFGQIVPFPAWMKAVIGLSLPIMANISEIVRGAVRSVPSGQWEAAESLSFSRRQTLWQIILPQCFKRMIPPWMNWYAVLTTATPLCSLVGVGEVVNYTRQAMAAEDNHPELLIPFYGYVLLLFFVYCYPLARFTLRLERRFALKL